MEMFHIMSGGGYMTLYKDHNFYQIIYYEMYIACVYNMQNTNII